MRIVLLFKKKSRYFDVRGGYLIKTSYDNILYKFYPLTGKGLYSVRTVSLKLVFVLLGENHVISSGPLSLLSLLLFTLL